MLFDADPSSRSRGATASARVRTSKALDHARVLKPIFEEIMRGGVVGYDQIAAQLNLLNIPTRRGSRWTGRTVNYSLRLMRRLGLEPGPAIGPYGTRRYSPTPGKRNVEPVIRAKALKAAEYARRMNAHIAKLREAGVVSAPMIAEAFNATGIKTQRGGLWTPGNVYHLLSSIKVRC